MQLFGFDFGARGEIADLRTKLSADRLDGSDLWHAVELLAARVERQGLVLEALLALLKSQGITEDAVLRQMATLAEQRSGPAQPKSCPNCGKPLRELRDRCIHCGTASSTDSPAKLF